MNRKSKSNHNALNCRIDPALLALKKPMETNREFVERALACLRDGNSTSTREKLYYNILVKMLPVFMENQLTVSTITAEEGEELMRMMKEEGLL